MKTERLQVRIAAYLLLVDAGKILLQRRYNTGYQDGNYGFVAGHFDPNETAKDCIIREAKEEIDIELREEHLSVVHVCHDIKEYEYIDIYLRADTWSGSIKNMEAQKCDDLSWFDLDALPENMIPKVRFCLEKIQKGEGYSEYRGL